MKTTQFCADMREAARDITRAADSLLSRFAPSPGSAIEDHARELRALAKRLRGYAKGK